MMTYFEFVCSVTEQLDQLLNNERPIRYDDIEEIRKSRTGEIGVFCAMSLGTKDMDVSIN